MKEREMMPVYTIGIAAELLGVCSATLRIWEKKGIVKPARIGKNCLVYLQYQKLLESKHGK